MRISLVLKGFQFKILSPLPTTLGCYELRPTALGHAVTELPGHLVIPPRPYRLGKGRHLLPCDFPHCSKQIAINSRLQAPSESIDK
jgi:hypothetical protein